MEITSSGRPVAPTVCSAPVNRPPSAASMGSPPGASVAPVRAGQHADHDGCRGREVCAGVNERNGRHAGHAMAAAAREDRHSVACGSCRISSGRRCTTGTSPLAAKLADFGGWEMPIEYAASGGGVLREHAAVREAVGLFDVSHLGKARVRGAGAAQFVNDCLSNDLGRITAGQAQYTLCCDDSGGVVDDLIAYLVAPDEVFLVPNAANTAEVVRRLAAAAPPGIEVVDNHRDYGVLAVQGPRSAEALDRLGLPAEIDYMAYTDADLRRPAGADLPHRLHRRTRL